MSDEYFVHDPECGYFETFATEEEALDDAKKSIDQHLDGEWNDGVKNVIVGKITHEATQTNLQKRPPDDELDEDGCDEDGVSWQHDFVCDYEMLPIIAEDENQETEDTLG